MGRPGNRAAAAAPAVMIADGHALVRRALSDGLTAAGFVVLGVFSDARDLLRDLRRHKPQVAIIELPLLPHLPDARALAILRAFAEAGPDVKLLILTSESDPRVHQQWLEEGVAGVMHREEARPEAVFAAVRLVAAGGRLTSVDNLSAALKKGNTAAAQAMGDVRLSSLTQRELEVLRYLAVGADNLKISAHLGVSERTVRAHVTAIYRKLGGENRAQLAVLAQKLGVKPANA